MAKIATFAPPSKRFWISHDVHDAGFRLTKRKLLVWEQDAHWAVLGENIKRGLVRSGEANVGLV